MKKLISSILIIACVFALLTACNEAKPSVGLIEDGEKLYFTAAGGTVVIENGKASPTSDAEGSFVSKKFTAPDTADDYFVYKEVAGKINITGLTETGKAQSVIILPKTVNGKEVAMISAGAFDGLNSLIIATPKSSVVISDNAFRGVANVYLAAEPDVLGVGANLFSDTENVNVFVCADEYDNYKTHYSWGAHSAKLSKY